jgi:hypothetical protein
MDRQCTIHDTLPFTRQTVDIKAVCTVCDCTRAGTALFVNPRDLLAIGFQSFPQFIVMVTVLEMLSFDRLASSVSSRVANMEIAVLEDVFLIDWTELMSSGHSPYVAGCVRALSRVLFAIVSAISCTTKLA